MLETGITIDGIKEWIDDTGKPRTDVHTYKDLGLILATYYLPQPSVKDSRISIPYSSGTVDLTESAGYIPFNDRDGISFTFLLKDNNYEEYFIRFHNLANMLQGRKLKVILDSDPNYYYNCRLNLDPTKTDKNFSHLTITGTADPFKYALLASNEPWKWNPFSFVNGKIEESLADLEINGTKNIRIPAGGVLTAPTFYVYESNNLSVEYDSVSYSLNRDRSTKAYNVFRFPQIRIGDEDTTLTFRGKGKISIEYRGRYL